MPAALAPTFDQCLSGDGALKLRLSDETKATYDVNLEWISRANHNWEIHATNPLGQPLIVLKYLNPNLTSSGTLAPKLPSITIDDNGFFEVDGHFVPIKPEEITCLLKFKLPQAWLQNVYEQNATNGEQTYAMYDSQRHMIVRFPAQANQAVHVCSVISWGHFLGLFKSEVRLCSTNTKPETTELTGIEGFTLSWINQEE